MEARILDPIPLRHGHFISHLFYADDIMIFCKASTWNIEVLAKVLSDYRDISGQVVSLDKSSIFFGKAITPRRALQLQQLSGMK